MTIYDYLECVFISTFYIPMKIAKPADLNDDGAVKTPIRFRHVYTVWNKSMTAGVVRNIEFLH